MKFSATILALCLVQQASAFVAPQAPKASLLPLTASPNGEVSQRTGTIPESRTVRLAVGRRRRLQGGIFLGTSNRFSHYASLLSPLISDHTWPNNNNATLHNNREPWNRV